MGLKLSCPVCGGEKIKFFCEKDGYKLYDCWSCRLGFVWPMPSELAEIYRPAYFTGGAKFGYADYEADKKVSQRTFHAYLKIISRRKRGGKIFDIGAATGYFLGLARADGWQTSGSEISAYAAGIARSKGHEIYDADWPDLKIKSHFDAVTMWDVLEHLNEPEKYLKAAHELLAPGGILAINTINRLSLFARLAGRNWQAYVPPEHLFYYSIKSLEILLARSGFKILEKQKIGKSFSLSYIFKTLARGYRLKFLRKLSDYFAKSNYGKISLPLNLGDNIFILAEKI